MAERRRPWRAFTEARAFVRALGLKNQADWQEYSRSERRPGDIPSNPNTIYAAEWHSWGDWLGTGTIALKHRTYRPFPEARAFVRALGLKNQADWRDFSRSDRKPDDIPSNPYRTYKAEWHGWGDWLGTDTNRR